MEVLAHVLGGDGVVGDDLSATLLKPLDNGDGPGVPDVVSAGFERETEHGDALSADVDVVVHEGEEALWLLVVDLGGGVEHQWVVVLCAGGCADGGGILREAAPASA